MTADAVLSLSFKLRPDQTIESFRTKLTGLGITSSPGAVFGQVDGQDERQAIHFRDPDGHMIEVYQEIPWQVLP